MLTLPDAYCLFNRARGAELISPDDMSEARRLWKRLNLPYTVSKMASGVTVIHSTSNSAEKVLYSSSLKIF